MVDHIVSVNDSFQFPVPVLTALKGALASDDAGSMIRFDTTVGNRVFISDGVTEKMISGDTGPRKVTSVYRNGATSVTAGEAPIITRVGNLVTLQFTGKKDASVSGDILAQVDIGWRPITTTYLPNGYSGATMPAVINALGEIKFFTTGLVSGRWMWSWTTSDPWPTTLPGVAF